MRRTVRASFRAYPQGSIDDVRIHRTTDFATQSCFVFAVSFACPGCWGATVERLCHRQCKGGATVGSLMRHRLLTRRSVSDLCICSSHPACCRAALLLAYPSQNVPRPTSTVAPPLSFATLSLRPSGRVEAWHSTDRATGEAPILWAFSLC